MAKPRKYPSFDCLLDSIGRALLETKTELRQVTLHAINDTRRDAGLELVKHLPPPRPRTRVLANMGKRWR